MCPTVPGNSSSPLTGVIPAKLQGCKGDVVVSQGCVKVDSKVSEW